MLNLNLKNPFTKPVTPPTPSAPAAEASVKGKQLLPGRTKAKVETLKAQVEDARKSLVDAKQTLGERLGNEEDVTSITRTVKQAHDRLDALEAALAVAIQKDESAQADLKDADRQAQIEKEVEACAQLRTIALEWDQLFAEIKARADALASALNDARALCGGQDLAVGSQLNDVQAWFVRHLHRSCAKFIPVGAAHFPVIDKPFSAWAPDPESARTRKREGQRAAKNIPSWQ